jgi:hypothetical protein
MMTLHVVWEGQAGNMHLIGQLYLLYGLCKQGQDLTQIKLVGVNKITQATLAYVFTTFVTTFWEIFLKNLQKNIFKYF